MKTPPERAGGGTPPEGNAEQVQYWNESAGPRWAAGQEALDERLAPFGTAAMDRGRIAAGEHVLDVGCGCGATTIEIARRVGTNGSAVVADISRPMLEVARRRAPEIPFLEADAQTFGFAPSSFDVVFSRFGVMFFADPRAAFANLRKALRPSGRLAFICWQALQKNPWLSLSLGVAARHVALQPPPAPDAPGGLSRSPIRSACVRSSKARASAMSRSTRTSGPSSSVPSTRRWASSSSSDPRAPCCARPAAR
ncbi:MAG: class I SAM-dependent methyltransferase [Deltaproteobacteria bacterium]|nr:class I SAM-dependent methyltransferase [Deltaproteobacteria bacterium]